MEEKICAEVFWTVSGAKVAARLCCGATLSCCRFFLDCFQGTTWHLWLYHGIRSEARLQRLPSRTGPESVAVDFEIHLLKADGETFPTYGRGSTVFKKNTYSKYISLCYLTELLDEKNKLICDDTIRLSVRMWPSDEQLPLPVSLFCYSKAGRSRTVTLALNGYSSLKDVEEREYVLKRLDNQETELKIVLFKSHSAVCVYAKSEMKKEPLFFTAAYVVLHNGSKKVCWNVGQCMAFDEKKDALPFIYKSTIKAKKRFFLQSDTLKVCFQFTDFRTYSTCTPRDIVESQVSPHPLIPFEIATGSDKQMRVLEDDFSSLLDSATLSDFTLNVGLESIPVHKSVLCARSPVFSAMLTSQDVQSIPTSADVSGFSPESVRIFARFLYSDSLPPNMNLSNALRLYELSRKYDVSGLRERCTRVLLSGLCPQSACRVLSVSDAQADSAFQKKVMTFIREHKRDVLGSREWVTFKQENPDLALQVTEDLIIIDSD